MSDALDLGPIKAREEAATDGPWYADEKDSVFLADRCLNDELNISSSITNGDDVVAECVDLGADRTFIAHARTDIPALITEVESLRSALAAATDAKMQAERERDAIQALYDDLLRLAKPMFEDAIMSAVRYREHKEAGLESST